MAFPVSSRSTGTLITATIWNADLKDNLTSLYAGALAISSQAALDFRYASSATQMARLAAAAYSYPRLNSAGAAWEMAKVPIERLAASADSGTTTNAAAENVATVAVSGLTAKDTLVVELTLEAVTQQTAGVLLYNSTDSVALCDVIDSGLGAMAAGREMIGTYRARQLQSAATAVMSHGHYGQENNTYSLTQALTTFTTNWTGSWTLALRQTGVTAGGTLKWSWTVYVIRGQ